MWPCYFEEISQNILCHMHKQANTKRVTAPWCVCLSIHHSFCVCAVAGYVCLHWYTLVFILDFHN